MVPPVTAVIGHTIVMFLLSRPRRDGGRGRAEERSDLIGKYGQALSLGGIVYCIIVPVPVLS